MPRSLMVLVTTLVTLAAALPAAAQSSTPRRPNVLLIMSDDLNSDLMRLGRDRLIHRLRQQLPQALVERFLIV